VTGLRLDPAGRLAGVELEDGEQVSARTVVLTTGTFLGGLMHTGLHCTPGGRVGDRSATRLTASLQQLGLRTGRLKTGTPPRLAADSIDFDRLEAQESQHPRLPFAHGAVSASELSGGPVRCFLTRTTRASHRIIRAGLDRSPLFTGRISGIGPRYCPSIEDKVVRFADRDSHQVVLEPVDLSGQLIYPNGISTSLPFDVQQALVASIPGLEEAVIVQPGYAVEYDFVPPTQLDAGLQTRCLPGLFLAGQINGTSGYEEAAGQGLLAGLNASAWLRGQAPVVLARQQAYLGVLVDDLISRGTEEPYRMFSSRAEFRLLLREDNAVERLQALAEGLGLVPAAELERRAGQLAQVEQLLAALETTLGSPEPDGRRPSLAKLLRRPEVRIAGLLPQLGWAAPVDVLEQVEVRIKYQGYVERQLREAEQLTRQTERPIPAGLAYAGIQGLSRELREKLAARQPRTFHQASLVDGMTPAALMVLGIYLDRQAQAGAGIVPRGTVPGEGR
jgi:tRNA uridine 5-carboxymethylaminomethyl modification enzyme